MMAPRPCRQGDRIWSTYFTAGPLVRAALKMHRSAHNPVKAAEATILVEPTPAPIPVDGAKMLDEIEAIFLRYISLPQGASVALALWTPHTWALDAATTSPRLGLCSPVKRCG